jgi:heme exporter protein B
MLLMPRPIYVLVLGKVLAQWLVCAIPLLVTAPLLGVQFGLSVDAPLVLAASLTLGTPVIRIYSPWPVDEARAAGVGGGQAAAVVISASGKVTVPGSAMAASTARRR